MTSETSTAASLAGAPSSWGWALASGLLLVLAGVLALAAPSATTVAVTIILGWILTIAGVAGIVMGLRTRRAHQRWIDLLYGVASLAVGLIVLFNPLAGALSFTLAFAFWLALRGGFELAGALRGRDAGVRVPLLVAGVINLLLAGLLLLNFPYPAVQVIGLFVGISFLVSGIVTVIAAVQLRRLAHGV